MRKLAVLFSCALAAAAQPVIAPTQAPVGSPRGQDAGSYNVVHSFETGYRFRSVGGSLDKYRSDVNFGNGIRLLGGNLSVHSKEGHGAWFDELLLNTLGLGNDPYQFASLRAARNRLYRYDMLWRLNEYFNPALPVSAGQHRLDTVRTLQDHSLVLLPQSPFKLLAGYSRVNQNGPALSTTNFPDLTGDEFALFTDVRRIQDEFRLGAEFELGGAKLSVLRGWEGFRDDTRRTSALNQGAVPDDRTSLESFRGDGPTHGYARSWRANLLWDRMRALTLSGRFASVRAHRDFVFDESAAGSARFQAAANRQILVFGDAQRPVTNGSFTLSLFPRGRATLVNQTSFYNIRMEGKGGYRELNNATLAFSLADFQLLGIRTISNATEVNVRATESVGLLAGYQLSTRRIRSVEQTEFEGVPERRFSEQENRLHAGRAGIRIRPLKPLSLILDAEVGRADRPIYPISERNYHAFGWRAQYKARTLFLSAAVRTNYNVNSVSLFSHSSKSRNYGADASWTVRPWLSFDANWSKLHLDTLTGLAYFYNRALTTDRSTYISNIHSGTLAVRAGIGARAELYLGYSRVEDTGDGGGQRGAAPATPGASGANITPGALAFQVFPLSFDSPMARLSIRLHNKVRWNAGYQHYRYSEQLLPVQNYRAHTGFSSLTWSF